MVVLAAEVEEIWYRGAPTLVEGEGGALVLSRPVDAARLPAPYAGARGRAVVAVDASGRHCPATLGEVRAVARILTYEEPQTPEQISATWHHTSPALAAELELADDQCGDIAWAMIPAADVELAAAPAPLAVTRLPEARSRHAELVDRALASFRQHPAYRAYQSKWRDLGRSSPWHQAGDFELVVIEDAGDAGDRGGASVVVLSAGHGGCGSALEANLTVAWQVVDGELGAAIELPGSLQVSRVIGAADLGGDGLPELLIEEDFDVNSVLHSEGGDRYLRVAGPETVSHVCRC